MRWLLVFFSKSGQENGTKERLPQALRLQLLQFLPWVGSGRRKVRQGIQAWSNTRREIGDVENQRAIEGYVHRGAAREFSFGSTRCQDGDE